MPLLATEAEQGMTKATSSKNLPSFLPAEIQKCNLCKPIACPICNMRHEQQSHLTDHFQDLALSASLSSLETSKLCLHLGDCESLGSTPASTHFQRLGSTLRQGRLQADHSLHASRLHIRICGKMFTHTGSCNQ